MNRNTIIIAIVLVVLVVIGAVTFVSTRPTVPDGGGADTNTADSRPGNPDGASGAVPN